MADGHSQSMVAFMHLFTSVDVEAWRAQAACTDKTELFFPVIKPKSPESYDAARLLCRACPVLDDCRRWVDALPQRTYGFVAGTTAQERQRQRSALRRANAETS